MKFSYISTQKRTLKMSITHKEYVAYEATDKRISVAQEAFISLSALQEVLETEVTELTQDQIMEAVELLLESGK